MGPKSAKPRGGRTKLIGKDRLVHAREIRTDDVTKKPAEIVRLGSRDLALKGRDLFADSFPTRQLFENRQGILNRDVRHTDWDNLGFQSCRGHMAPCILNEAQLAKARMQPNPMVTSP